MPSKTLCVTPLIGKMFIFLGYIEINVTEKLGVEA